MKVTLIRLSFMDAAKNETPGSPLPRSRVQMVLGFLPYRKLNYVRWIYLDNFYLWRLMTMMRRRRSCSCNTSLVPLLRKMMMPSWLSHLKRKFSRQSRALAEIQHQIQTIFRGAFFISFWELIRHEVVGVVEDFFRGTSIPKTISSTFIALIPKSPTVSSFPDFRPTSLSNFVNKVFTRILVGRLKSILQSIISPEQSAFLSGRDISDNILLAQVCLQFLSAKRRNPNVLFKVDEGI